MLNASAAAQRVWRIGTLYKKHTVTDTAACALHSVDLGSISLSSRAEDFQNDVEKSSAWHSAIECEE